MIKLLKSLALVAAAAYLLLVMFIYVQQRSMMFLPNTERVLPEEIGLSGVIEISLNTWDGNSLHSWYAPARQGYPTLLFLHGNGGSVAGREGRFRTWMNKGFGLFVLGYPGYGGSEGFPSEESFREGSQMAYEYLVETGVAVNDLVIYGQSIGTGVAVPLASENPAKALVLEAPMTSVLAVAKEQRPYLPIQWMLKDKFLSIDIIDQIAMPLLIVHGDEDRLIGIEHGRALYDAALEPKVFMEVKGAAHNNLTRFFIEDPIEEYVLSIGVN